MINKPIAILLLAVFQLTAVAQQTFQLDVKKSKILWKAPKTMGNQHYGKLGFNSGNLIYSLAGQPLNGSFNLNMNSISSMDHVNASDNISLDNELKGLSFFAVAKYPTASMKVKKIMVTDRPNLFNVAGDLTIKGITNPINFTATIKKKGDVVYVTGTIKIDRIKWNINHQPKPRDFFAAVKDKIIPDEFPVSLNLVFIK